MTKSEFLDAAMSAARATSAASGLPVMITVAQAALESNWGNSQLSQLAHNYFGIKAHGEWPTIEMPTHEAVGGVLEPTVARFARYPSMEACFADRDALILRLPVYAAARACALDPEAFARELARHWATDPNYAEKLLAVYHELLIA